MADYRGPMLRAVSAAIGAATIADRDRAAAELARRYAVLIDNATPAAKYAAPLDDVRAAVLAGDDEKGTGQKALDKITEALAEHSVASDLGPKLLAALTSLGLSVAGRAGKTIGVPNGGPSPARPAEPKPETEMERLRRERAGLAGQHGA